MFSSLRARLILLGGVTFLPLLAITASGLLRERRGLLQREYDLAGARVDRALVSQQDLIANGHRYLGALAALPSVRSGDSLSCTRAVSRVREILDEGWSFHRRRYNDMVDCTADGSGPPSLVVTERSPIPYPTPFRGGGATVLESYGRDLTNGEPVVTLTMLLRDAEADTTQAGSHPRAGGTRLSIRMRMEWMMPLARAVMRDSDAVVTLLDGDRRVIARFPSSDDVTVVRVPLTDGFRKQLEIRNGMSEGLGIDGVRRLWIFRELPSPVGTPVFISVGVPIASLIAIVDRVVVRSALLVALSVALALLAAFWAADRWVLRDVRALLSATERITLGDLTARTGLTNGHGELGKLARAFDSMASTLTDRQERLAHAQKMESVGQLAGGVAHDFNNLLTVIVGNTEAVKEMVLDNGQAQSELDGVLYAAHRSAQLTRQLLAFARQHTLATRVTTVDTLLANVAPMLDRLIGTHIQLRVSCDPELAATRVDPTQVEQAIVNLVVNARDAMPLGGTLTITVRNLVIRAHDGATDAEPAGRWVAVAVADSGVGMTPDVARRAFEPFFTTKPKGSGTGLGLAMVYGTARQHGGHVALTSVMGSGTTVRMLLPVADESDVLRAMPSTHATATPVGRGNETILLVEDDRAVRAVSARLLRSGGYDVIEAEDAPSGPSGAGGLGLQRYRYSRRLTERAGHRRVRETV